MAKTNKEELNKAIEKYLYNTIKGVDIKMIKGIDMAIVSGDTIHGYFVYKDSSDIEHTTNYSINKDDFRTVNRNVVIESLFDDDASDSVENLIYSDEQREKLEKLRKNREYENNLRTEKQYLLDKQNSFKKGDSVWFGKMPGKITFVGGKNKEGVVKYTVKMQDDAEHRFVSGSDIEPRKVRPQIEIPKNPTDRKFFLEYVVRYKKMSTERLIKQKNKNWNNINGDCLEKEAIIYVLQSREHHTRKNKIVVNYDKNK